MTRPRKDIVNLNETPYYHIISRCVRQSYLCGFDKETNTCYEHRRLSIVNRIRLLASIFSIKICTYAVMSNHYHLVVKIDSDAPQHWKIEEVIRRWTSIFSGTLLAQKFIKREKLNYYENLALLDTVKLYRERLGDLGWFMKCLNQPIARQANKEDGTKGHFWDSRYDSHPLKTDKALLSAMAYVDLNPIRAKEARTPETSKYTGIEERINPSFNLQKAVEEYLPSEKAQEFKLEAVPLFNFKKNNTTPEDDCIPVSFDDYLNLVDTTGRVIRLDKRGYIDPSLPKILERLDLDIENWLDNVCNFLKDKKRSFGGRRVLGQGKISQAK